MQPQHDLGEGWENTIWSIFNQIEKDANERFSKPRGWAELGEKLKVEKEVGAKGIYLEAQPEEVDEDSIPF